MRLALAALLVLLVAPPASVAADGRLRELDHATVALEVGAGNVLAGRTVVAMLPRKVFGWPVTGGTARLLTRVPRSIGPADNELVFGTGFHRVAAAEPGRIAVIRDGGPHFFPRFQPRYGKQLLVGPPRGPLVDPAGCGEAAGAPVSLDADRIAYRAAPAGGECPGSAVGGDAIVVRDLAGGNRVEAIVPLPEGRGRVTRVELAGPFVAYSLRPSAGKLQERLVVADTRTGVDVLRLPAATRAWALGPDGTVASAGLPFLRCNRTGVRVRAPGDPVGEVLPGRPCDAHMELDDGALRFTERAGRRYATVDLDLATGERRVLATTAGLLADADAEHLVLEDPTCATTDLRIVALADGPITPAETRRCLRGVRVPRTVRAGRPIRVRVTCPRGCRVEAFGRVDNRVAEPVSGSFGGRRSGAFEVGPPISPFEAGQTIRLRVESDEPAARDVRQFFTIRVRRPRAPASRTGRTP